MDSSSFASKFIARLNKIDTSQVETFLTQLVKEKNIQRAIFDSLHEGIILTDHNLRVEFVNEPVFGLLGLGRKQVLGEPLSVILRSKRLRALVEKYQADPQPIDEVEIPLRTPQMRVYSISAVPIKDEGDAPSHSLWIIKDQTETHRRAAERHQYESIQSMSTLTAGIAHEIKNPLNSLNIHAQLIRNSAKSLASTDGTEKQINRVQESSDILIEEIERLTKIVDQFIQAVRPKPPELQPTNLNEIFRSIVKLIAPECKERNIIIREDFDPVLPKLKLDPHQIQQAVLNIVKNGMESIDKPEGILSLRTALKNDYVLLEIGDNGCGIPEEDRIKIFEPYHSSKFTGTGLGLMVVYRIIKAHHGAIGLDSMVGEGSQFRIALPLDEKPVRLLTSDSTVDQPIGQKNEIIIQNDSLEE